jgi:hypothetical protein
MTLPSFFVIGAAKAGTTSLYALLDRHPDIFMPEIKEPEFFARDDLYARGITEYEAKFDAAKPGQVVGEASTIYTLAPLFPKTAERVRAHVPDAKLIYVMRQPVDRAYSFYVQIVKTYQNGTRDYAVHRSFEEFTDPAAHARAAPRAQAISPINDHLPDVPELCLAGSDYLAQIEAWLEHFPREAMLFLKFEDFVRDRRGTTRKVTDFLGLDPLADAVFDEASVTRNISKTHFDKLEQTARLQGLNRRFGPVWGLRQLLPVSLRRRLRDRALKRVPRTAVHEPPAMKPQTRAALQARFSGQFDRLEKLTGLSFDDWRR